MRAPRRTPRWLPAWGRQPERPEHKEARQKAKAVNFAVIYGRALTPGDYREQVRGYCRNARHERPRRREGLVQLQVKRRT